SPIFRAALPRTRIFRKVRGMIGRPERGRGAYLPTQFTQLQEVVEEELGIGWARGGLGVELDASERLGAVPDPLVGPVVGVEEPGEPVLGEAVLVYRVAVILRGDVTALAATEDTGLVLPPVAVLQLVRLRPGCQGQDLAPQANAEDRNVFP